MQPFLELVRTIDHILLLGKFHVDISIYSRGVSRSVGKHHTQPETDSRPTENMPPRHAVAARVIIENTPRL